MALTVTPYLTQGASATAASATYSETMVFAVTGFRADGIPSQHMLAAAIVTAPGIPQVGSFHPYAPVSYARVKDYSAEHAGDDRVLVKVTYTGGWLLTIDDTEPDVDPGVIEIGATLTSVNTNVDKDNQPITVEYTYVIPGKPDDTDIQLAEVQIFKPQFVISREARRTVSPRNEATTYVGSVNSALWESFPPRTLLCTRIQGTSNDLGQTYNTLYEFQYNPDTWDQLVQFKDEKTGRTPADAVQGTGWKKVRVYPERSFGSININL